MREDLEVISAVPARRVVAQTRTRWGGGADSLPRPGPVGHQAAVRAGTQNPPMAQTSHHNLWRTADPHI